jgi:hypothetical protein
MRTLAADHARFLAPLDVTTLRWSRQYTPRAWAAALLARAANNTLPDTPAEAAAMAEYDLHDTDAATWTTSTIHAAADLAHRTDSSPLRMATAVLTEHATKRCNETPPAATPNADEYRYSPAAGPGPAPPTSAASSPAANGSSATRPCTSSTSADDLAASAEPPAASPNTDDSTNHTPTHTARAPSSGARRRPLTRHPQRHRGQVKAPGPPRSHQHRRASTRRTSPDQLESTKDMRTTP